MDRFLNGYGKGEKTIGVMFHLIFEKLFRRMAEERLMLIISKTEKIINDDKYHFGYEVLFSTHSSPVVPKGSPIKVLLFTEVNLMLQYNATLFQQHLNQNLQWMRDTGIIQKMYSSFRTARHSEDGRWWLHKVALRPLNILR